MDHWTQELEKVHKLFDIHRRAGMTHLGAFRIPTIDDKKTISDYFMSFNTFADFLRVVNMHIKLHKNSKRKIGDLMKKYRKKGTCYTRAK